MNKFRGSIILFIAMICLSGIANAQEYSLATEQKQFQKEYYSHYSRWSMGVNMGLSSVWGDFRSFSKDKTYLGYTTGLNLGYQLTPTVGVVLSGAYGRNKAGAAKYNYNRLLGFDGITDNDRPVVGAQKKYGDLYAKINSWTIGLNGEINVNNLFWGNDARISNRKWSVLVSPGFYMQYFDPTVYDQSTNRRYTEEDLFQSWQYGLGGDVALRFKVSKAVDFQFKTTAIWMSNSKFDGIASSYTRKANVMGSVSVGMVWKLGTHKKSDHLMYASTPKYVNMAVKRTSKEGVVRDTVRVEVIVEKEKRVEVKVKDLPILPTIHFDRGNAVIDEVKYAQQLHTIVASLTENKEVKFQVWGYADHSGNEMVNENISYARAQAMCNYLISQGIAASRIQKLVPVGKDPILRGAEAFSESARRIEIVKASVE